MNEQNYPFGDEAYNIDDFTTTPIQKEVGSEASIRNRAATYALLGEPEKVVENYRRMVAESMQGGSLTRDQIKQSRLTKDSKLDYQTAINILSDRTASFQDKEIALKYVQAPKELNTTRSLLQDAIVTPNPNETPYQEDIRVDKMKIFKDIEDSIQRTQGITNAHIASLPSANVATMVGAAGQMVVPFGNSLVVARIMGEYRARTGKEPSLLDVAKAFLMPGSSIKDLREELASLPPAERVKMHRELVEAIANTPDTLLPGDRSYSQFQKALEMSPEYDYSNTDAWLDNLSNVLDTVGLGFMIRGFKTGAKALGAAAGVKGAIQEDKALGDAIRGLPAQGRVNDPALSRMPVPDEAAGRAVSDANRRITALEEQKAALLGDTGGRLENGAIRNIQNELDNLHAPDTSAAAIKARAKELQAKGNSYKQAMAMAEKEVSDQLADFQATQRRLGQQLQANAAAAQAEQRLFDIEKEIEAIRKGMPEGPSGLTTLAASIQNIGVRSTAIPHHPAAPGNILMQGNPNSVRAAHVDILKSPDDELAKAMFGVTRTDALAANVMPQATTNGVVVARPGDVESILRAGVKVDTSLMEALQGTGSLNLTDLERASVVDAYRKDLMEAAGPNLIDNMTSVKVDGDRVVISAVMGGNEGGYKTATDALADAVVKLRQFGVDEQNIGLLKRDGVELVPVDMKNIPEGPGEWFVKLDTRLDPDLRKFVKDTDWDVKWNFFDRVAGSVNASIGSLTRHLFTANMIADPKFTRAAARASDYTSNLERTMLAIATDFAKVYNKLDGANQKMFDSYVMEANLKGLPLDQADLIARGFTGEMIDAANKWRRYWDNHYYLENYDMVRTLRSEGWEVTVGQGPQLFTKAIPKNQNITDTLDLLTGAPKVLTKAEMDDLYNKGGTLVRLKSPTVYNGNVYEHAIVPNNAGVYNRALNDNDKVLNYLHGYFQIQYQAPVFVDEIFTVGGKTIRKAIAVSGDSLTAENFAKNMRNSNPDKAYKVRRDDRSNPRTKDDWWDVHESRGRIAQRVRGDSLFDTTSMNQLDGAMLLDPVQSAVRAARSIAGRTIGRPFLETAKARVIAKYGDIFPPMNGEARWPVNIGEIGMKGGQNAEEVANARTMYEYINYLENGYANSIDDFYKGMLNSVAAKLGEKAKQGSTVAAKAEKLIGYTGDLSSPASLTKNIAFTMYMALAPLRQLVVQPASAIRMLAYDPKSIYDVPKYINEATMDYIKNTRNSDFTKFVDESGMLTSVDKHNLVRGALVDAEYAHSKSARVFSKVSQFPRQIGFDKGEQMNMLMHLSAVYGRYKRLGKNKVVREEAMAVARAISGAMNFAGDMPYNQNILGPIMQFMQVPHKALALAGDRSLSVGTRMKLLATDTVLYGGPMWLIQDMLTDDVLPEDQNLRRLIQDGFLQFSFNNMIEVLGGGVKSDADFGALNPYDIRSWTDFFKHVYDGGAEELMMNSAGGGLLMRDTSPIHRFISSVGRLFGIVEDPMELTDLKTVVIDAARLAKGFDDAYKAKFMLETEKRINAAGMQIDEQINVLDAAAQLLGFGSYDARKMAEISKLAYEKGKDREERIRKVYNEVKRYYTDKLGSDSYDLEWQTAVTGHVLKIFHDDPEALRSIKAMYGSDIQGPWEKEFYQLMKLAGYVDPKELRSKIATSNMPEDKKQQLYKYMDTLADTRATMKEGK